MKQITIAGNIGRDAEVRTTQGGDKVAGFPVAVSDRQKNTTWFDCSLWGKRGESLAQYLKKGSKVAVTGELTTREHEGKTYLGCRVSELTLLGSNSSSSRDDYSKASQGGGASGGADLDDEIPFLYEWRI